MARIALIGDYSPEVTAHRAIPLALERAARVVSAPVTWEWIPTAELGDVPRHLEPYDAIWLVPASPYASTAGALNAIRFARESGRAYLGTCAGFQHALLEYAEAFWDIGHAAHAELEPEASDPVISVLSCRLVEVEDRIRPEPGSRLAGLYGRDEVTEGYHCNYGLNPRWAAKLASGPLRVAAHDTKGEVRAVELQQHPFFIATLYQPERSALKGLDHPLIAAFVAAACDGVAS